MKSKVTEKQVCKGFDEGLVKLTLAERRLIGVASTGNLDRQGDIMEPGGWVLDAYQANPVVLWNHDSEQPPVAKAARVWVEDGRLLFEAQFPPQGEHPFADLIYGLYAGGYLRGFSIKAGALAAAPITAGGIITGTHYQRQELWEISCVALPANAESLVQAVKALGAGGPDTHTNPKGDKSMDWLKKIKSALGLGAEADEAAVEAALNRAAAHGQAVAKALGPEADAEAVAKALGAKTAVLPPALVAELGLAAGAGESEALGAVKGLKQGRDQAQGLAAKVAALEEAQRKKDADEAVEKALKAGKITPAQKKWADEYAEKDLAGFNAYVEAAPQLVHLGGLPPSPKELGSGGLDLVQKGINAQLGLSDEAFKKHNPDRED